MPECVILNMDEVIIKYRATARRILTLYGQETDHPLLRLWEDHMANAVMKHMRLMPTSRETLDMLYLDHWQNVLTFLEANPEWLKLPVDELANRMYAWDWVPEMFEQDREWEEQEAKEEQTTPLITTNQFLCMSCGKRECVYYLSQTRSADEGMTQYITCVHCGKSWKNR
jgi:DNA-directed RNA polymerase subunit M/transcription elongation factor TFIIS